MISHDEIRCAAREAWEALPENHWAQMQFKETFLAYYSATRRGDTRAADREIKRLRELTIKHRHYMDCESDCVI